MSKYPIPSNFRALLIFANQVRAKELLRVVRVRVTKWDAFLIERQEGKVKFFQKIYGGVKSRGAQNRIVRGKKRHEKQKKRKLKALKLKERENSE